jgi:(p)ppGpp synthase/HD superfamily hydrolase
MNLYERALKVAIKAHDGQKRKHDGSAYVAHPIMVARFVEDAGFSSVAVAAALVHDVLEDTPVTEAQLRAELGDDVVDIVTAVSEDTTLPWEERKEAYVRSVISAGELVWAVSVADKIHNAQDLIEFYGTAGSAAWQVFNRGKDKKIWFEELLYTELSRVWQHPLLDTYRQKIAELKALPD